MDRLLGVMGSQFCKDSLSELMEMNFETFFRLEMHIVHMTYREEERAYNKYLITKPKG